MSDGSEPAADTFRESFNLLHTVIHATQDAMIAITAEGRIAIFNPAAEKMFGRTRAEMIGKRLDCLMPVEYRDKHQQYVKSYFATGQPCAAVGRTLELPGQRRDGTVFPMEISLSAGEYGGGEHKKFVIAVARDITQRRRAEAERRAQLERVRAQQAAIVELATHDAIVGGACEEAARVITETAGRILDVERTGIWLLSADQRQLRCVDLFERSDGRHSAGTILDTKEYPRYFEALRAGRGINSTDARTDPRTSEFTDGYLVPLGIGAMLDAPIRLRGQIVGVVCHEHVGPCRQWQNDEVTFAGEVADQVAQTLLNSERKQVEEKRDRLEAQIRDAQKLESLGVLAAGIARDFNNLLVGVLGYAGLARRELPADSPALSRIDKIEHAAHQAEQLTNQLLAYAGEGRFMVTPLNLAALIEDMTDLLAASVSKEAVLEYDVPKDLPPIPADRSQLRQLIMNLVTNASEALGERAGTITIQTEVLEAQRTDLAQAHLGRDLPAGRYVCLTVSDTGCGMDEQTRARVFDPFFTTKSAGRGLGLAAVLGVVRGHHGAIHIESEPGRGATFRILLPCVESASDG